MISAIKSFQALMSMCVIVMASLRCFGKHAGDMCRYDLLLPCRMSRVNRCTPASTGHAAPLFFSAPLAFLTHSVCCRLFSRGVCIGVCFCLCGLPSP